MKKGNFYFLNDQYFIDFPDSSLMKNKETLNGVVQIVHVSSLLKTIVPHFIG